MSKLAELTSYFVELREDDCDDIYDEEKILNLLNDLEIYSYESVPDIPTRLINQFFTEITESRCDRLDPNQEQEILDFLENSVVKGRMDVLTIAKALRYLLRQDVSKKTALLIIDVQNDFISGSLALRNTPAAQEGEEVVAVINGILEAHPFNVVAYSLDWHPADHCSFASNVSKYHLHKSSQCSVEDADVFKTVVYDGEKVIEQVLWPDHCVQDSEGAKLHEELKVADGAKMIYKGKNCEIDSYSAFWDNGKMSQTELLTYLFDNNITEVMICGLAYDFCVGMTSLDSAEHGFVTYLIEDAARGVAENSIEEMKVKLGKVGATIIQSDQISHYLS